MSTDKIQKFRQILSDNKQSVTKARLRTFELLLGSDPQSMNQMITRAAGTVDRVSIYRNIELFESIGIVKKIHIGWKYKVELSDIFTDHHHHLVCLVCGSITDIDDEQHIEDFIRSVAEQNSFQVKGHLFEIEGYCRTCSSK